MIIASTIRIAKTTLTYTKKRGCRLRNPLNNASSLSSGDDARSKSSFEVRFMYSLSPSPMVHLQIPWSGISPPTGIQFDRGTMVIHRDGGFNAKAQKPGDAFRSSHRCSRRLMRVWPGSRLSVTAVGRVEKADEGRAVTDTAVKPNFTLGMQRSSPTIIRASPVLRCNKETARRADRVRGPRALETR